MKRVSFLPLMIFLMSIFLVAFTGESPGQYAAKTVTATGNASVLTLTADLDSLETHYSGSFSLNFYDFTSNPIGYATKVVTAGGGTAKVSTFIDASYDNTNWITKVDTIQNSDSVETWHKGTLDFNLLRAPYYRLHSEGKTTNPDSIDIYFKLYYKKE